MRTSVSQTNATRPIAFPEFIPAFFKLTATWELDWTLPRPAGETLGDSVQRPSSYLPLRPINTMSLKRKASFSAMPSSPFAPASSDWDMTDSSKHLHSRTRKRFRDGRPNDEAVYGECSSLPMCAQCQYPALSNKQPSLVTSFNVVPKLT